MGLGACVVLLTHLLLRPAVSQVNGGTPVQTNRSLSSQDRAEGTGLIKILNLNVWGFRIKAEDKKERLDAIAEYLQKEDYDVVFIQELWYNDDFQQIKNTFPYSTYYGSPNSWTCPSIANDKKYPFQLFPVDCNGLTILSKTPITDTQYEFFEDRITGVKGKQWMEYFAKRGLLRTRTVIEGKKVSLINTHLGTWHSDLESTFSHVREAQAQQVVDMAKAEEEQADLVIVAGDTNSTPESPVMKKFTGSGIIDAFAEKKGANASQDKFATFGNEYNTYTSEKEAIRIDYILYKGISGSYKVTSAGILDLKADVDGQKKSVSDHMGIETVIKIS